LKENEVNETLENTIQVLKTLGILFKNFVKKTCHPTFKHGRGRWGKDLISKMK